MLISWLYILNSSRTDLRLVEFDFISIWLPGELTSVFFPIVKIVIYAFCYEINTQKMVIHAGILICKTIL